VRIADFFADMYRYFTRPLVGLFLSFVTYLVTRPFHGAFWKCSQCMPSAATWTSREMHSCHF